MYDAVELTLSLAMAYPGAEFVVRNGLIDEWPESPSQPNDAEIVVCIAAYNLSILKSEVDLIRKSKVDLFSPIEAQMGYIVRYSELKDIVTPTQNDLDEIDALRAIKNRVYALNDYVVTLKAALDSDINTDINAGWPE